ncbi:HNH endonuclease [Rhodococcus hoagii]|nr:HNH endonuclease [Prescottella equi]
MARGGEDTLDNLAAAHRGCNRDKGDRDSYTPGVTFITERQWD